MGEGQWALPDLQSYTSIGQKLSVRSLVPEEMLYISGRKQVVIEVATIDEDSEEELEDVETPNQSRQKRWQRVAQAAVKQCLRWGPFVSVYAKLSLPVCLENFKDMHKHACICAGLIHW